MQGTDKLFLVYRPLFHKANGRQQLILTAKMTGISWSRYLKATDEHEGETFTITILSETIDDIISGSMVKGYVYRMSVVSIRGQLVIQTDLSDLGEQLFQTVSSQTYSLSRIDLFSRNGEIPSIRQGFALSTYMDATNSSI